MERRQNKKHSEQTRRSPRLNPSIKQQSKQHMQQPGQQQQQPKQKRQQQKQQQQQESYSSDSSLTRITRKRTCQIRSESSTPSMANCSEEKGSVQSKRLRKKEKSSEDPSKENNITAVNSDSDCALKCRTNPGNDTELNTAELVPSAAESTMKPVVDSGSLPFDTKRKPTEDDSDDDLPEFLSAIDDKFAEEDLVWVKYQSRYYWPALVLRLIYCRKKLQRVKVAFIEYENKQLKHKPINVRYYPDRIQPIAKNYQRFVIDGKNSPSSDSFKEAIERIEKFMFCHDKTIPNAKEFFEIQPSDSNDEELDETVGDDANDDTRLSADETDDIEEEETRLKDVSEEEYSEETRRCIDERRRKEEELVKCIIGSSLVKEHLKAVRLEHKQSAFQTNFKKQCKTRRENFAVITQGFGPLRYDSSMVSELTNFLMDFICEVDERSKKLEDIYYLMDVWMPEAIICGIQELDNVTREEAEQIFQRGIQYTNEEKKRTTDLLIASTTDTDRKMQKERSQRICRSQEFFSFL